MALDGSPAGLENDVVAQLVLSRGVAREDLERHRSPSLRNFLPDPSDFLDMDAAAERLAQAVLTGEKVTVYGDYDVDGATSAALLLRLLAMLGREAGYYIPDRLLEGYGPSGEALVRLAQQGSSLIAVDCGAMAHEALSMAKRAGVDVIVVDHHKCSPELPEAAALVNPNRLDESDLGAAHGHLAAVGVAFLLAVALVRALRAKGWFAQRPEPDLRGLLDLVALGTVADVAALHGLNRAFVTKGLISLRNRENHGLRALMDAARLEGPPEAWHLGFLLGPRINAGGRIGDATLGTKLLTTNDPAEANAIAQKLNQLNIERQEVEKRTLEQAEAEAYASLGHDEQGAVVIASGEGWHPGVVGLVAARLKERFSRPAFAIAMLGEQGTGSGRSIPGVDLGRAVRGAVEEGLLVKGGGHAMAAGLTVTRDKLGDLRAYLEARLREAVEQARHEDCLEIDAAITARGANGELFSMIERAGPFGSGNPEPVFALPAHTVAFADPVGQNHVRVRLRSNDGATMSAVAFRAMDRPLGQALLGARGRAMHVAGTLSVNRWQGRETIEMRISDAANADPLAGG